jgi:hypothetical protein
MHMQAPFMVSISLHVDRCVCYAYARVEAWKRPDLWRAVYPNSCPSFKFYISLSFVMPFL